MCSRMAEAKEGRESLPKYRVGIVLFSSLIMLALFLLIWTILSEISLEFSQLKKGLGFCFAF